MNVTHLTYQEKNIIKWNWVLKVAIGLCWAVFVVATFLEMEMVYDAVSIVLTLLSVILYIKSKFIIGKFWSVARWFCTGTFIWFIADIVWFLNGNFFPDNAVLSFLSDGLYLLPDYMFLIGLVFYAKDRFDKTDFQMVFIDAFVIAIITFLFSQIHFKKYHGYTFVMSFHSVSILLYSFVTLFIFMIMVVIYIKTGLKKHTVQFYIISAALMIFDAFEVRYTFFMFEDKDPESPFIDIIFLLCIATFAIFFSDVKLRDIDFSGDKAGSRISQFITGHFTLVYWVNTVIMLVVTVVLYYIHFFEMANVFYMVTISLAYVIMCKTIQANILSEELIARQKDENARLERMVEEKTRELKEMNEHLEYISNVDALTGIYNRRYGVELLAKFIKDENAYPVTLFSLDLNHFKPINDNYGHDMGDVVLKEVGHRLGNLGQDRCTAIRVGGDEFLLIFRNSNKAAIENMAKLICERMDQPIEAHMVDENKAEINHILHISACIGIASFPNDATDIETLYKMADEALYSIKHKYDHSAYMRYDAM